MRTAALAVVLIALAGGAVLCTACRGNWRSLPLLGTIVAMALCVVMIPQELGAGHWNITITRHGDWEGHVTTEIGYFPDPDEQKRCEEIFFRQIAWTQYKNPGGMWRDYEGRQWHEDEDASTHRYKHQEPWTGGGGCATMHDDGGRDSGPPDWYQRFETCAMCKECETHRLVVLSCIRWTVNIGDNKPESAYVQTGGDEAGLHRNRGGRIGETDSVSSRNVRGLPPSEDFTRIYPSE